MYTVQSTVVDLSPGLPVQRLEFPHGRKTSRLLLLRIIQLGSKTQLARLVYYVHHGHAIVARSDDVIAVQPDAPEERQVLGGYPRDSVAPRRVGYAYGRAVADPADLGAAGTEGHVVHPSSSVLRIGKLAEQCAQGGTGTPGALAGLTIHVPYVRVEDSDLVVGGAGRQDLVVGVPVDGGHR